MLSILIPTYNTDVTKLTEILLKQCDYSKIDYEIIIIDDCSTKPIFQKNIEHPRLKLLKNEQNIGRTATRGKLNQQAKFEWLLFLDADVLPTSDLFIANYTNTIAENANSEIVVGGIAYEPQRPKDDFILRWKYGHQREAKPLNERLKNPECVTSPNLLIKKETFLLLNQFNENMYGIDNVFSHLIKKENIRVTHIQNPMFHLGLEDNVKFLQKSLRAIDTTIYFESKGILAEDARPIQQAYLKLKRMKMICLFSVVMKLFKKSIEKNLHSKNPSLFLLDLYRLSYYQQQK